MDAVIAEAGRVGAWIISDEVYRGTELSGRMTPSFWGRYPRVLITSGLSKAFGLPGLRIGWVVGPAKAVAKLESYHDYLTLTPGMLSDRLATIAMQPGRREMLLSRTQSIVRAQWPAVDAWIRSRADVLDCTPPCASAVALIQYALPISANRLFDRLRSERSVLITPGIHFGLPGRWFRVGFGYDIEHAMQGLARISEFIAELRH
jgi:hypothetical protein